MAIGPTDIIIFAVAGIAILLAVMKLLPRIIEGVGAMNSFEDNFEKGMSSSGGLFGGMGGGGER